MEAYLLICLNEFHPCAKFVIVSDNIRGYTYDYALQTFNKAYVVLPTSTIFLPTFWYVAVVFREKCVSKCSPTEHWLLYKYRFLLIMDNNLYSLTV